MHDVVVYDDQVQLIDSVAAYVAHAVRTDGCAVVVATPTHRAALETALRAAQLDVNHLAGAGVYVPVDASATLKQFMVAGRLDEGLFQQIVGALLDGAASEGRNVRVFGEMVALLWEDKQAEQAIELEQMWNRLGQNRSFNLLCGYPAKGVEAEPDLRAVTCVSTTHARITAPNSYAARGISSSDSDATFRVFVKALAAIPAARHWTSSTPAAWGEHDMVDAAATTVTELATNALRHAESAFRVALRRTDQGIRVECEDSSGRVPMPRPASLDSTGGRGISLLRALAADYGWSVSTNGKVVWAELAWPAN